MLCMRSLATEYPTRKRYTEIKCHDGAAGPTRAYLCKRGVLEQEATPGTLAL